MTRKERFLWPLADGAWTGLCLLMTINVLISTFFTVNEYSFYLLAAGMAVVSSIPAWVALPRYRGLGQRFVHLLAGIPGFLLVLVLGFINLMTVRWFLLPIRVLDGDGEGILMMLYTCLCLIATAALRLILIFVRRNKP